MWIHRRCPIANTTMPKPTRPNSLGALVATRFIIALKRTLYVIIPGSLIFYLLVKSQGSDTWFYSARAHHETRDCITNLHDYASIDKMFDEIILEPRTILLWTTLYGGYDFGFGLGQNPFSDHKCRNTNCLTTTNRSTIKEADAVVFHWNEIAEKEDLPKARYRKRKQKYVFFNMEPPLKMSENNLARLQAFDGYFNLTMSYMSGSSIINPYSAFIKRTLQAPKVVERAKETLTGKKKMIAWYSHCDEEPLGKAYVDELRKFVSVTTYGPCGKEKCGPIDSATCWDMFERDYYFFLSIEAVMCKDFITDRTYRPLQFNIVPIVYAGGNFSQFMPANSHINVLGFPNPKHLAEFLLSLTKNPGAYMWYMEFKKDWQYVGWGQGFCDLCDNLNNKDNRKETIQNDLSRYWSLEKCGKNYMDEFKAEWPGNRFQ